MDRASCVCAPQWAGHETVFLYVMGSPQESFSRTAWWRGRYWGTHRHIKVGITRNLRQRLHANRFAYGNRIGRDAVYLALFALGMERSQAARIETHALQVLRLWQKVLHLRSERVRACERLGVADFARNYSGRSELFNMSAGEALAVLRLVVPMGSEIQCVADEFA